MLRLTPLAVEELLFPTMGVSEKISKPTLVDLGPLLAVLLLELLLVPGRVVLLQLVDVTRI